MKKLLKILVITLGVILVLLIVTPILFKSKIEAEVKEKVNEEVHARVDWSRFSLSFFRGFPDLSINLHQVSVVGVEAFEGDTLAGLQRFELRVNPFSAIRKDIVLKSILVERPLINAIVLEDGSANWDISAAAIEEEDEAEESAEASSLSVSLKRFAITDGRIYYLDETVDMETSLEGFQMELRGDLSMEQTELIISGGIDRINAKMDGIRYLRDGVFKLDLIVAANLAENRYSLKENLISLNGLTLGVEGDVLLLDDDAMELDLKFFSRETTFKTLLSLVPAIYLQDFESLKTSGTLQLDGTVSGVMKDSILPDATLNLQVRDGYFSYPDLPRDVSDVRISLMVDYRGADMDKTLVDLQNFHLLLGGNPFDLSMQVDHPISDMHVAGKAIGSIDFASLQDIVPMKDMSLGGRLEADLRWDTRMSYIENENFEEVDLDGSLLIEGMLLEAPELPVPLVLETMNMLFSPRIVELTSLDLKMGASDLHIKGELVNFIPYVFDGQTISGRLAVRSALLDANELMPELEETAEMDQVSGDTLVPVLPDSLAEPIRVRIPENMDLAMSVDMRRVEYAKILFENIKGEMHLKEGVAGMDPLRMDLLEGSMLTSGWLDTRGEYAEADFTVDMKNVDIPAAYKTFVSVGKLAPIARYFRGKANVDMEFHSLMDVSFAPLYESMNAKGQAKTEGLQFYNMAEFLPLTEILKNEKFNEMAPDEVYVGFTVKEGRVIFNPFTMDFYDSEMTVSGSHGIDLSMDYTLDMKIARTDLGSGANEMFQGMTLLAAGAGLKIPQSDYIKVLARIEGTFNHPKLSTDLSGNMKSAGETIQEALEEKVTGEIKKVEEEIREEAEKLITDAETEAARLIEEARKAGEALMKEAELQGEKLMEEAGSNPLKQVAAKSAAGELKRQAEKQSASLVSEAELKAAALIQKAREEAGRI
ncbi:MAG: AsmA-like C-terminal region-containing protein [Bacteroidales bacterium]|nr:AsmA-like C-terminal region-containing protein [Bacteroidales bacterium]